MKLGSTYTLTSGTPTLIADNDGHSDVIVKVKPHNGYYAWIGDSAVTTGDGYRIAGENATGYSGASPPPVAEPEKVRLGAGKQLYAIGSTGSQVDVLVTNV